MPKKSAEIASQPKGAVTEDFLLSAIEQGLDWYQREAEKLLKPIDPQGDYLAGINGNASEEARARFAEWLKPENSRSIERTRVFLLAAFHQAISSLRREIKEGNYLVALSMAVPLLRTPRMLHTVSPPTWAEIVDARSIGRGDTPDF